jgi:hypothetical protein
VALLALTLLHRGECCAVLSCPALSLLLVRFWLPLILDFANNAIAARAGVAFLVDFRDCTGTNIQDVSWTSWNSGMH